jgi:hypothetical protein
MARSYSFVIERRGHASAEKAFALIRDAEAWAQWAGPPISYSAWKEDGSNAGTADGSVVGRTRLVGNRRFPAAEEITIDDPPHTHGYRIPATWPVRDYNSVVNFIEDGSGGLTVLWSGTFTERIPGTGYLWRGFLNRLLGRFAERLIKHAGT